jgi:hypothetical protein
MDSSERIVFEYLSSRGFSDVVYEPDGNVPPDFLIDGRIAVEVRRLNQHDEGSGDPRGLEEVAFPLDARIRRLLPTLGGPVDGESRFVLYTFKRPVPPWSELEESLRSHLDTFRSSANRGERREHLQIARGFAVNLIRASKPHPSFFVHGGSADHDSGGFVVAEMDRNIRICVADKARKVARVRDRYSEWWLALVDHIGYGILDDSDRRDLRELVGLSKLWEKVLLINPLPPHNGFEL